MKQSESRTICARIVNWICRLSDSPQLTIGTLHPTIESDSQQQTDIPINKVYFILK